MRAVKVDRVREREKATPGTYEVTLTKVAETECGTRNVLRFWFSIKGSTAEIPNYFDVFDLLPGYSPQDLKMFQWRVNKIFNCFNIGGAFEQSSYMAWVGATGKVEIVEDEKGFLMVKKFFPKT